MNCIRTNASKIYKRKVYIIPDANGFDNIMDENTDALIDIVLYDMTDTATLAIALLRDVSFVTKHGWMEEWLRLPIQNTTNINAIDKIWIYIRNTPDMHVFALPFIWKMIKCTDSPSNNVYMHIFANRVTTFSDLRFLKRLDRDMPDRILTYFAQLSD